MKSAGLLTWLVWGMAAVGCGGSSGGASMDPQLQAEGSTTSPAMPVPTTPLETNATESAASPFVAAPMGASAEPSGVAPAGSLPCDVVAILDQYCVSCHGSTPTQGAPLSLVTADDFTVTRDDGMTVGARVLARVKDPIRPMPPPPDPLVKPEELATLTAFVEGGSQMVPNGCAVNDVAPQPMAPGSEMSGATPTETPAQTGMMPDVPSPTVGGTDSWQMFGYDLANSRANTAEEAISAATVPNLQMRWQFTGAATTSTPAVMDGTVYLPTWDGTVRALSLQDGTEVWTARVPNLVDSSPALTETQVFVADNAGFVHALARADGSMKWSVQVDTHPHAHLWSSPVYVPDANIVVVGVASGEEAVPPPYTFRGSIVALDADDGTIKWQFYTTEGDATSGPGVAVWATAAVDTTRKTLYVGTGNNYSAPSGQHTDAMLAIDYTNGDLVWSHQFTAQDVFTTTQFTEAGPDADVGSTANLFSVDGKDLVGIGVKNGIYYALDRDTGDVQWMASLTAGSVLGGVISPSAYADGVVYVASNRFFERGTDVIALNAADGQELWRSALMRITYGGVAYANGVVYVGNDSAQVVALNAVDGAMLWSDSAPNAIAGGPSVANGLLLVPWGYQWTLGRGIAGTGGLIAYGL
ncbi:MAG: PQQ-binding-like beta-propeller repeat protein [Myxococcales bacterium]|nr:PQQ-binding-like beta-propeller repeat protein [Myxococcales bacterium]